MQVQHAESSGVIGCWNRFWFEPADPIGLHVIRLLTGIVVLGWLLGLVGDYQAMFGKEGWFDNQAWTEARQLPLTENVPLAWGSSLLADAAILSIEYWGAVVVVALFTIGIATRVTGPLSWLAVVVFSSHPAMRFEGDSLLLVLSMYLMVGYALSAFDLRQGTRSAILGDPSAPVWNWTEPQFRSPTVWANLTLRLIQVHFAVILFVSGIHKLQDPEWWAGDALWYALYPPFETDLKSVLARRGEAGGELFLLSLAAYATLLWQIAFPFFAWSRWGRWIAIAGAGIGWAWLSLIAGMPIFGPALFIACLSLLPAQVWADRMRSIRQSTTSATESGSAAERTRAVPKGA